MFIFGYSETGQNLIQKSEQMSKERSSLGPGEAVERDWTARATWWCERGKMLLPLRDLEPCLGQILGFLVKGANGTQTLKSVRIADVI